MTTAGVVTALIGIASIVLWGAASTALPPMLQAAAMRTAPDDPDGASGLYVTAFQVGIMAGSLSGGLLYEGVGAMIAASTAWWYRADLRRRQSRALRCSLGDRPEVTFADPEPMNTAAQRHLVWRSSGTERFLRR